MALKKNREYDPLKLRQFSEKRGLLISESVEGNGEDLKAKIREFKQRGINVAQIQTEPCRYKYTFWYYKDETVGADLNQEEWRDLEGDLAGCYQISNLCRLRSIRIISENNNDTTLTGIGGTRHNVRIRNIYEEIFGKKWDEKRPSSYKRRIKKNHDFIDTSK